MFFFSFRLSENEDMANLLLKKGLETYQQQMDDKTGVNNYWSHIERLSACGRNEDNLNWKTSLKDPKLALKFLKSLPCQKDNLLDCKNREFSDRHVKEIVDIFKNEEQELQRNRKISGQPTATCSRIGGATSNTKRGLEQDTVGSFVNTGKLIGSNKLGEYNDASSHQSSSKIYNQHQSSHFTNKLNLRALNRNGNPSRRDEHVSNESDCRRDGRSVYNSRYDNVQNSSQEDTDGSRYRKEVPQAFRTAKEELHVQQLKKNNNAPPQKKMLGGKRPVNSQFICPIKRNEEEEEEKERGDTGDCEDERLKNIDPKMVELIKNEIMDSGAPVSWDDIAGLEFAKNTIKEIVVFPLLRPDIFTGLRRPPKGILLFGPPGTGKTLIGKCIASQSKSTFFSISASSLTSKWIGEGEKMVRALFAVARVYQPAVVFIDEIDSLLSQRSETEHESSRRIKTEFLVQLDGAATAEEDRILVIGATNRPQELDEAARRRLVKRLYVPLPEFNARSQIIKRLLKSERHNLTEDEVSDIARLSEGYSGADMTNLCKEASMGPIRSIPFDELQNIQQDDVRGVTADDFKNALSYVRSSVSQSDLTTYVAWDRTYGTGTAQKYGS